MITLEEVYGEIGRGFIVLDHSMRGGNLILKVVPRYGHEMSFNIVEESLKRKKIYPFYRKVGESYYITLATRNGRDFRLPPYAHLLLLAATLVTVTLAGYLHWAKGEIKGSLLFSIALMSILMSHELGHYIQARIRNVKATLPFFIPVPPNIFPFGTMGAVITMSEPFRDRSTLIRVGIAGPIAGFILSLPFIYFGLAHSTLIPAEEAYQEDEIVFVMPLAMHIISRLVFGSVSPDMSIDPHPLAMAGWIGLFVTSLNLLPLGQLDGGHVIRALFSRRYHTIYRGFFVLLIVIGLFIWPGWLFWALIVYLLTKLRHPGPLNDVSELSTGEKFLGLVYIAMLLLTFVPVPFIPAEVMQTVVE